MERKAWVTSQERKRYSGKTQTGLPPAPLLLTGFDRFACIHDPQWGKKGEVNHFLLRDSDIPFTTLPGMNIPTSQEEIIACPSRIAEYRVDIAKREAWWEKQWIGSPGWRMNLDWALSWEPHCHAVIMHHETPHSDGAVLSSEGTVLGSFRTQEKSYTQEESHTGWTGQPIPINLL